MALSMCWTSARAQRPCKGSRQEGPQVIFFLMHVKEKGKEGSGSEVPQTLYRIVLLSSAETEGMVVILPPQRQRQSSCVSVMALH